ncbi:HAD-IA family hydrolase [Chloroflexia bacterium SDU3-3]|nr:HAD-IA family hydrolase [Chloroflexia bacterium SDU3-3]
MSTHDNTPTRAALWDMDGTLLDSAEYHWLSWRDTLEQAGWPVTETYFQATFGQRNDVILRGLMGEDLSDSEIARIGGIKEELYRQMVRERGIHLLPGVRQWLDRLQRAGFRQAVASSAPRANVDAIIDVLDIAQYFSAVTSAEDVTYGKPDPQVFQLAAQRLGAHPAHCVVFEDAPAGVEAARRASMRVVGILSTHGSLQADVVVRSLEELPEDAIELLLARES